MLDSTPQTMPRSKERMRVSRACDYCKRKKIRCTGEQPCDLCTSKCITCTFETPYSRGKRKKVSSIRSKDSDENASPAMTTASTALSARGSLTEGALSDKRSDFITEASPLNQSNPSSRGSPEIGASDKQGHFLNDSSSLSFLLRVHRRLKGDSGKASPTSVFTLGDPALPTFQEAAFTLPSPAKANALAQVYFELSSAAYRFLHRPTVKSWIKQLYDCGQIAGPHAHSKLAVILSMFAQATRYGDINKAYDGDLGLEYFQAAERELAHETESASLHSAQALLGCCFYVLTRGRLNHCWSLFGTTSRHILALGFHRLSSKQSRQSRGQVDYLDWELRKRLFWCAYNLDKTLSTILGRPCALHDCDIDQDLPNVVDDDDLSTTSMNVSETESMSVILATIHNQRLGRILSKILTSLYGLQPLTQSQRYRSMKELGNAVEAWKEALPAFLNSRKVDARLLKCLFQRQSNILSLAAGHAEMLIYRPCLFSDYKRHHCYLEGSSDHTVRHVTICLQAATETVRVIQSMAEAGQLYAASWVAHYQAFCAVVVLYTFTLKSTNESQTVWEEHFRAADRCQTLLASINNEHSLARRFMMIMEEYRAEVMQHLPRDSPYAQVPVRQSANVPAATGEVGWNEALERDLDSFCPDLPNWEQLDFLAFDTSGFSPGIDTMNEFTMCLDG